MYIRAIPAVLILFLFGCASLPLQQARSAFYVGNFSQADQILQDCNRISEKNRLLCYMEKGLILHYMKEYEQSTDTLLKASSLMETQKQVSITNQTSAVLINDRATVYKGEYSERLWVHTYLMMNFLLQYRYESALVEAKQAIEVFDDHPDSLAADYFTRALVALCYENMMLPDDARIEYEKLAAATGEPLFTPEPLPVGKGELVLFIGQGRAPTKIAVDTVLPNAARISLPRYAAGSILLPVTVRSNGGHMTTLTMSTDLGNVARKSLDDRAAQYLTRQALRAGAKEAIAQEVGDETELGEVLVRTIFFFMETADTRTWETLPGSLTLVRMTLDSGVHDLEVTSGYSETVCLNTVEIPEGMRVYRSLRF